MAGTARHFFHPAALSCAEHQEPLIARNKKTIAVHPHHQRPAPSQPTATKPRPAPWIKFGMETAKNKHRYPRQADLHRSS